MANLTERQRNLLRLVNQMSQNLVTNNADSNGISKNISIDLPGFDFDAGANLGLGEGTETPPSEVPGTPGTPTTLRDVLLSLVNEQVEVTTPFGTVTGTLLSVRDDYIVIVEATGDQVLVRIESIELVNDL
ncbi:DUF2642 domain-containing protein [Virgibacillus ainsalahensis]